LEKMSFNKGSDIVLYRGEHFHPTLARNFDVSDPLEWIARITSHIPRKGAKQVIYYGAYSQAWRGRERRRGIYPTVPAEEDSASSVKDSSSCSRHRKQLWEDSRPPPQPLELVCEPCADYVPWQDDVPEIEVG
jgi:hypothetical protein